MNKLKMDLKYREGITLISLVVTIIILIILASISISMILGKNGLLNKAQTASDETKKSQATETMNLKITNIQISSYAETQQLPNLQYLADKLCEDNDMEYVLTVSKEHASLDKIDVTNISSIFTKLKEYPYEFEINSSLQLASIDGVKIASNNSNSNGDNQIFNNSTILSSYSLVVKEKKYNMIKIDLDNQEIKNSIKGYVVFVNDEVFDVVNTFPIELSNLGEDKEYNIYVYAIDKNGNIRKSENTLKENTPSSLVNGWNLYNENNGLAVYKGTPIYNDENTVYLNNTVFQTNGNYVMPQKYTMIFEMGKIEYTTNAANCMPIIGTGTTNQGVGGTFSGLMYNNSNKFMLTNGKGDSFNSVETNSSYDNTKLNLFVIRYDGTNLECFINGTLAMSTTGVSNKNTPLYIGGAPTENQTIFNESATTACFKRLAIYERAFIDSEIVNFQF